MKKSLLKLSWFLYFIIQMTFTAKAQVEMNEKIIADTSWKIIAVLLPKKMI
jgi:hypothetical protein